jgi:hypothetical protein
MKTALRRSVTPHASRRVRRALDRHRRVGIHLEKRVQGGDPRIVVVIVGQQP